MWKTITVVECNIALLRKQHSEVPIGSLADYGDMPAKHKADFLDRFAGVFTIYHNPHNDYGSNRLFQSDLKEVLEKDEAYTAKPSLTGLLKS